MFFHVFRYRLLATLRDRSSVFWVLVFPLLLLTTLSLVMAGIIKNEIQIQPARAAVVKNQVLAENQNLSTVLEALTRDPELPYHFLFVDDWEEAQERLRNGEVDGILEARANHRLALTLDRNGLPQTLLAEFVERYEMEARSLSAAFQLNPLKALRLLSATESPGAKTTPLDPDATGKNPWLSMFFAEIAMTALYAGLFAVREGSAIDPAVDAVGIRQRLAPANHLRLVLASFLAVLVLAVANLILLLVYGQFLLGLDFGLTEYPLLIALLVTAGAAAGTALGFFVSAFVPGRRNRYGILIAVSMIMTFAAGLMVRQIPDLLRQHVPFLHYLNPADLLADAFYRLVYFADRSAALKNAALLIAFASLLLSLSVLKIRRTRLAHL